MAHRPRHEGGFSQGQSVIGSPQSSVNQGPPGSGQGSQGYVNPYAQAAQSMQQAGITSLSGTTGGNQGSQAAQQQQDQGFQTIQQAAQQANQQAAQQEKEEKEIKEKKEKKKVDVVGTIKDFYDEYKNLGGVMGLGLLPFRMIAEPNVETFQNPQALAVLKLLFDEKGQKFKDEYLKDHGDLINEAFKDDVLDKSDSFDFFDQQLENSVRMSEEGILGAGSQEINFPAEFYTGEQGLNPYGAGGMPQTTGGLANLAGLDVNQFTSGPGYNQQMVDMIFAARAELDRMGKDQSGNPQGGGQVAGIPSIPGVPSLPVPKPGPIPPSYPLPGQPPFIPGIPSLPPGVIKGYRPPYDYFAQSPQYTMRGLPTLNTNAFNENLRKYYG